VVDELRFEAPPGTAVPGTVTEHDARPVADGPGSPVAGRPIGVIEVAFGFLDVGRPSCPGPQAYRTPAIRAVAAMDSRG
jgi:hypothetical protein